MTTNSTTPGGPSSTDYYKSWIALSAIKQAIDETNFRSAWALLACDCCSTPDCWNDLPLLDVDPKLKARIRWYDHVQIPHHQQQNDHYKHEVLSNDDLRKLQSRFVGHHQRIEMILLALQPSLNGIYDLLEPYKDDLIQVPEDVAQQVIQQCHYAASGWTSIAELVVGVASIDRIKYLEYVPRLAGVSGGNSPLMMPLTTRTVNIENLFSSQTDAELERTIRSKSVAGRIGEAFIDLIDSVSRCWMDHVVTATTTIGITAGTKGTPNTILVDRVLKRMHSSRLLRALGSLREPLSGIGVEMKQLYDYDAYHLADHYLDVFDDPGPEFGTHNVGWQPREYDQAKTDFLSLRRKLRTDIWDYFYSTTRPSLCHELCKLLGVQKEETAHFGFGSNVTEVLARVVSSLSVVQPTHYEYTVVLADDEFVTLQRSAVSLARHGATIQRVAQHDLPKVVSDLILQKYCDGDVDGEKKGGCVDAGCCDRLKVVVFVSLVNSCTQRVQQLDWISDLPSTDVIVIVDVTQAVCNLVLTEYMLNDLLTKGNVFVVGSLIKHARCGEGIGFLAVAASSGSSSEEPDSGWTAYPSGLVTNTSVDIKRNRHLYDNGLEWSGGTPGYVESGYVAVRILTSMPPVQQQNNYVQGLKASLLDKISHLLSDDQIAHTKRSGSNTVAIPITEIPSEKLRFGLDYKIVGTDLGESKMIYLRIGLGVHNLPYHIDALVAYLTANDVL